MKKRKSEPPFTRYLAEYVLHIQAFKNLTVDDIVIQDAIYELYPKLRTERVLKFEEGEEKMEKDYIISEQTVKKILEHCGCDDPFECIDDILKTELRPYKSDTHVALDEICARCPIRNEEPLDDDRCAESCEGCLISEVRAHK